MVVFVLVSAALTACGGAGEGEPIRVHVPPGASFSQVTDSLARSDIIDMPFAFKIYGRVKGMALSVKPGTYAFKRGTAWSDILKSLHDGSVLTMRIVIPEAWDLRGIAPRIAAAAGLDSDSILGVMTDAATVARFGVPGPTLEGYLYPATYTFPLTTPLDTMLARMVHAYRQVWTPERRARADSLALTEREVVTLASIIEKEARQRDEMPAISGVYHNRLARGYRLEADPTVQYALGAHQARLLYEHIDSTAGNPYNTYRIVGLPPGPIASPSVLGIDAALRPAQHEFFFFVAQPDGSHVFTRNLEEHNRARAQVRRMRELADTATTGGP
ncbi:MAG TPA: endolytic transglycosylase MltG [Longimicrobiales bacterium]|nr:endolytic transglycosylase MltG [Longimicrobiales bacterium]